MMNLIDTLGAFLLGWLEIFAQSKAGLALALTFYVGGFLSFGIVVGIVLCRL